MLESKRPPTANFVAFPIKASFVYNPAMLSENVLPCKALAAPFHFASPRIQFRKACMYTSYVLRQVSFGRKRPLAPRLITCPLRFASDWKVHSLAMLQHILSQRKCTRAFRALGALDKVVNDLLVPLRVTFLEKRLLAVGSAALPCTHIPVSTVLMHYQSAERGKRFGAIRGIA